MNRSRYLIAVVCLAWTQLAFAQTLTVYPPKVELRNGDDAIQLIVTMAQPDGKFVDVTHEAQYTADAKFATVTNTGRVVPTANGTSEIAISHSGKTAKVPVTAKNIGENLPLNFTNQVVPIFTKLGCNSGGCHGKASGQNGFKISLLGFEPELDFQTLVKEGRGRRLLPTSPDASLFLLKATGQAPHGGGRKMDPASDEYKIVRRWIASGMPWGNEKDPTLLKISVYPEQRVLSRQKQQQFAVYAHYSAGSTEDITRRAQYESNDSEVAVVDGNALVRTLNMSGQAAIMARYQGTVATFRAIVPLDGKVPNWQFPEKNVVDQFTAKKWRELGLMPAELATDETFIRRASIDITGTLPTPKQVAEFLADKAADKREKLVDRLVETPEYAMYFANKWADVLRVKRRGEQQRAAGTFAFHAWIREAVATDMRYDEFVRSIITATGDETNNPPSVWYKEIDKPEQFVDDISQVFLGQRLGCAQCHHHPYEKWGQDDYWGLAAFYGRVGRKDVPVPMADANRQVRRQVVFTRSNGSVTNKRTQKPSPTKPLDAEPMVVDTIDDPRQKLADWMVDPKNPFFAKTVANRYWAHFFTRGIVDPLDDMRITNPPSNPELLDALTKSVIDNGYSLKALVKLICKSRTYQLSAVPNDFNKHDKQNYARYYPKRMSAEVLLDAVNQFTDNTQGFGNLPRDKNAPRRAISLPDESFTSYFLEVFGKPQRISSCECERVNDANLAQALHLLNSDEVQGKIANGGRIGAFIKPDDKRPDAEKVEELFLWAFGRKPTAEDSKAALEHIASVVKKSGEAAKRTAYENIVWALMNTKEFVFVQ
jgi:Protein of unknown function (DUF1553)/Protein of unknown function (DUF1549)